MCVLLIIFLLCLLLCGDLCSSVVNVAFSCEKSDLNSNLVLESDLVRRFVQKDATKSLLLVAFNEAECYIDIKMIDSENYGQRWSKLSNVVKSVTSPFVMTAHITPVYALNNLIEKHSLSINTKYKHNTEASILLFDDLHDPFRFELLPHMFWLNPLTIKPYLQERYKLEVLFRLPASASQSYELSWAHFRGNTQIHHTASLSPGSEVVQFTHPGHLFLVKAPNSSPNRLNSSNMEDFDAYLELESIVSLLLMPAVYSEGRAVVVTLTPTLLSEGMNLELLESYTTQSEYRYDSKIKNMLLTYWQMHRQVQILPSLWFLPSLPLPPVSFQVNLEPSSPSIPNSFEFPEYRTARNLSTKSLWTRFDLPSALYSSLVQDYKQSKESQSNLSTESYISLVFNQHHVSTYYAPLQSSSLHSLTAHIMNVTSDWLAMNVNDLEVSTSYGVREYHTESIVRWHVDPTSTQPITAIIHIDDDCSTASCWSFQVPSRIVQDMQELNNKESLEEIELTKGEVLLIQTAKLPHGRIRKYKGGTYYANAYVHLAPKQWRDLQIVRDLD